MSAARNIISGLIPRLLPLAQKGIGQLAQFIRGKIQKRIMEKHGDVTNYVNSVLSKLDPHFHITPQTLGTISTLMNQLNVPKAITAEVEKLVEAKADI